MGKGRMAASEGDLPDPGSVGRSASPPPVWVGFWPAELTDLIGRSQESSRLRALLVREGVPRHADWAWRRGQNTIGPRRGVEA